MINLFIDESGSMTDVYTKRNPYFVISIIKVNDKDKLKKAYKRFVRKYFNELKDCPHSDKMFDGDKFKELKGSSLTPDLKKKFVEYFCRYTNIFEIYMLRLNNKKVESKFYNNTARAFNYAIKLALKYFIRKKFFQKFETYDIQIDERNESTGSKSSLEDYLNTELHLAENLTDEIKVTYFDSANNNLIQIADVFSNLEYCNLKNNQYEEEYKLLKQKGILKTHFIFPQ